MKNIYFIILILTQVAFSQAPTIDWQRTFGGSDNDFGRFIVPTSDGGYITAAVSTSTNGDVSGAHGSADCWIVKMSSSGQIQWQKVVGGADYDSVADIKPTSDGGYIMIGLTGSVDGDITFNHGRWDLWIVKLSASGAIEWQKTYGGSQDDFGISIQQTQEGGYIVSGMTSSTDGDLVGLTGGYWIVKISVTGAIEWQKALATRGDQAISIKITQDGKYIVAGDTRSSLGGSAYHAMVDCSVVKLSETGVVEWQKAFGGSQNEQAYDVQPTSDGGCIFVGHTDSIDGDITENHGDYDIWIVRLSATGSIVWQKTFGGTLMDLAHSIQPTIGGYVIAGATFSQDGDVVGGHGGEDCWLIKITDTGSLQWQKTLGGTGNEVANNIQKTADGGFVMIGTTSSANGNVTQNNGTNNGWVVKLSPDVLGTSSFTSKQIKVFPNPTTSTLRLQNPGNITFDKVIITDLTGKEVLQQVPVGNQINVEKLSSGMYILQAFSGEEKFINKFLKE